jgi:di/tricarboxylate transporter
VTLLSGFMNNVGALALLMPVAIRMARKSGASPSLFLMPLAFGSLLGGMTTLIGTPPNIVISSFRADHSGEAFRMFDFFPVGAVVAVGGLAFIVLIGWRLIPNRKAPISQEEMFQIQDYVTEVVVQEGADGAGTTVRELEEKAEGGISIIRITRGTRALTAPPDYEVVREGDLIVIEAGTEALEAFIASTGFKLEVTAKEEKEKEEEKENGRKEVVSVAVAKDAEQEEEKSSRGQVMQFEAVVAPQSLLIGRTASSLALRHRYGLGLLGISRQGGRISAGLSNTRIRESDVLLLQGREGSAMESIGELGCLPLAERELRLGAPRRMFAAIGLFTLAIALAAFNIVPAPIALTGAAVAMVGLGMVPLRRVYDAVDWPVIVLLGAMIPVGYALESTGGAAEIAGWVNELTGGLPPVVALVVILVAAMFLSDLMNNAAAAVVMAPIGIGIATAMGVSADPFLMAIAVGASCAFLTPIGHQSNTLVMGPGGYRFSDYWRMGLPLEIIIVAVAVPLILLVWPF